MDSDELLHSLERMETAIPVYARAKGRRVQLEHFRKSKLALLARSPEALALKTVAERENYARAHSEYIELCDGLAAATEEEELHRWALLRLQMRIEIWRSQNANERAMRDKV